MPSSPDSRDSTGPGRHSIFDLQRARAARGHVSLAHTQVLTSAHRVLAALNDPSFCALSPDAAAVVLRKNQERIRRQLRRSLDR